MVFNNKYSFNGFVVGFVMASIGVVGGFRLAD